jgi:arylsulfatase A-like enzyme
LDETGQADDTLILYTTDNGFFLGDHGWYDKRFMYEESLRVPLLMRYPRMVTGGQAESRFAMNVDLAPTILDFAGIQVPESMQGRSLRPLVTGQEVESWRKTAYYSYFENSWAMRDMSRDQMTDPRPLVPVLDRASRRPESRCTYGPVQAHRVLHRRRIRRAFRPAKRSE